MKKIFFLLVGFWLVMGLSKPVWAVEKIYFFWAEGCPHCAKEKEFLHKLVDENPKIKIEDYDVVNQAEGVELLNEFGQKLEADVSGVPFTVIGDEYFIGWYSDEVSGGQIVEAIGNELGIEVKMSGVEEVDDNKTDKVKVPIIGEVDLKNLSLPMLTLVVALLDGFNPCAMWVLIFLISLLLGLKDKKRMRILGTIFIVTSAGVYFLFLSAWLNLFLFIGMVAWIRLIIAGVALFAGYYYLKDFFTNKSGGCKVTSNQKRREMFEKIKKIVQKEQFGLAVVGIILLAIGANMVELICSAGLPAVYTNILSLANLPRWQYYLYLLMYIVIFMIDDLFVFFTAMFTLKITGVESKYSHYSHLAGGILMLVIGFLLVFKPEWLMFG